VVRLRSLVAAAFGHAREAVEVGVVVANYRRPFAGQSRPTTARPTWATRPVILVHGFGHNAGAWNRLAARLTAAGFFDLSPVTYGIEDDVPTIAARIADEVGKVMASRSVDRVHLVGHSLGGVAIRYWHDVLGGDAQADAIVTLGAPLRGSPWTRLPFLSPPVRDLVERSAVNDALGRRGTSHACWTTVGGDFDIVVPARRAHLDDAEVVDVGAGHAGLLTSRVAGGQVCIALLYAEEIRAAMSG
jgi:pimeloyl-ACP methyl ester carboxylesterase